MKYLSLSVATGVALLSTAALAQSYPPPGPGTPQGRADAVIRETSPNSAVAHQRMENKPPAYSTQKSQGGEASPTAESK